MAEYCAAYDEVRAHVARDVSIGACGRRTEGLEAHEGGAGISVAAWFAEAAYLEAASVYSFRRLECELRDLGAPEALIEEARRSRADEIRHAGDMARVARRFGGFVRPVAIAPFEKRSTLAIAIENVIEGCVREAYGALVAAYQARAAKTPALRKLFRGIASDEARHAELAQAVARFLAGLLDDAGRAEVEIAREKAIVDLRRELAEEPAFDVVMCVGLPTAARARLLLDQLERQVLAA
jgi:hypothetical protein